jgi:hypothetical protein
MVATFYLPAISLLYFVTLAITGFSAYFVYKQREIAYRYVRDLLLAVHVFYGIVVVFEVLRAYISTFEYMTIYTIGNTSFVLIDVVLLTFTAVTIYMRPRGASYRDWFKELLHFKGNSAAFALFLGYIIFVDIYLVIYRPFSISEIPDILGGTLPITVFSSTYLLMLLFVLILFIAYPSTLLILARQKVSDPSVRGALIILPIAWTGIGLDLLIFNGYLLTLGIDATSIGYLFGAAAFSASATVFRRATLLVGFFEPTARPTEAPATSPFSNHLGRGTTPLQKTNILLEVDTSTNYEQLLADFATETIGKGHSLFVFSSKGSPVYKILASNPMFADRINYYILNDRISYPKTTDREREILVPFNNQPVMLDILDKTLKTSGTGIGFIFDSISDLIVSMGLQKSYQFLKLANEIMFDSEVESIFLITQTGHDEKTMALVKGLFANQLSFGPTGLKTVKWTEPKKE